MPVPYLAGMKSPVRRALSFSVPLSLAVLILGVSHEVGQSKAREDAFVCEKYFGLGRPGTVPGDPYMLRQVQICLDRRQTPRWGPWNAWPSLIPAPDAD
jgi:hypothetical protein